MPSFLSAPAETHSKTSSSEGETTTDHTDAHRIIPYGFDIPDLILFKKFIIDTKIKALEIGQIMNSLKIIHLTLGYILNFQHPKLKWKCIVL